MKHVYTIEIIDFKEYYGLESLLCARVCVSARLYVQRLWVCAKQTIA